MHDDPTVEFEIDTWVHCQRIMTYTQVLPLAAARLSMIYNVEQHVIFRCISLRASLKLRAFHWHACLLDSGIR